MASATNSKAIFCVLIGTLLAFALGQSVLTRPNSTPQIDDIDALNYALTLENLESTFYNTSIPPEAAFVAAGYPLIVYQRILLIKDHEAAHVQFLTSVINAARVTDASGNIITAALPCTYRFPNFGNNVTAFLGTADLLENTGTSAYDGAINTITSTAYAQAAATIATVEARHAAYLNEQVGNAPFGNASMPFDIALTPSQVLMAASGFIVSCPAPIYLPTPRTPGSSTPAPSTTAQAPTSVQTANGGLIIVLEDESPSRSDDDDDSGSDSSSSSSTPNDDGQQYYDDGESPSSSSDSSSHDDDDSRRKEVGSLSFQENIDVRQRRH